MAHGWDGDAHRNHGSAGRGLHTDLLYWLLDLELADMTREDYIDLFHRANANLVAFKQVFHCDEELRKMVEIAIADEREACAKVCEDLGMATNGMNERNHECATAIRARGQA